MAKLNQPEECFGLDTCVRVDAIEKLNKAINFDLKRVLRFVAQERDKAICEALCSLIISSLSQVEQRPQEEVKSLNSALRLTNGGGKLQNLPLHF